jgi:flagellar biosynthesis/type III secretory pathway protein FliH
MSDDTRTHDIERATKLLALADDAAVAPQEARNALASAVEVLKRILATAAPPPPTEPTEAQRAAARREAEDVVRKALARGRQIGYAEGRVDGYNDGVRDAEARAMRMITERDMASRPRSSFGPPLPPRLTDDPLDDGTSGSPRFNPLRGPSPWGR